MSSCAQEAAFCGSLKSEGGSYKHLPVLYPKQGQGKTDKQKEELDSVIFFFTWPVTHLALASQLKIKTQIWSNLQPIEGGIFLSLFQDSPTRPQRVQQTE